MPRFRTEGEESERRRGARIFALGAIFAMGYGVIVCRALAFHLQENEALERVAMRQYRTAVRAATRRGNILDAAGRELAVNVPVASLYADPRALPDPGYAATKLAGILGLEATKLKHRLEVPRKFVWIKRMVSASEAERVMALSLPGVASLTESQRAYPNGKLAATILGAVGYDAEALGGVELGFDDLLVSHSSPGEYRRDARGQLYLSPTDHVDDEKDLAQIELTIDKTLQYIAERELENGVQSAKARGGVAVVVDPMSGEILAMAVTPSFDPNEYSNFDPALWRNRAITDSYEPGSTFKVMVIAAALDAGLVFPDENFDCERGNYVVGPKVFHDSHPHGVLTVADIIHVSSNIGAAKVAQKFSRSALHQALEHFGLGRSTGLGLPGESVGILPPLAEWDTLRAITVAFGQGVSATPLQMTMAFAAIANGGELLRPRIVKQMMNARGESLPVPGREVMGRPVRPETARLMSRLLEGVVQTGGTGVLAASPEYPVAGKTGTAQKVDPVFGGYASGKYYSSFIGFAPADDPRAVVYVAIDEPSGVSYYGGQVAAPIFRHIMEATLHSLKIPARLPQSLQTAALPTTRDDDALMETARDEMTKVTAVGTGHWRLPNLTGLTMRGVLEAAGRSEVRWQFEGSGVAVAQEPGPGSELPSGAQCRVVFRPLL